MLNELERPTLNISLDIEIPKMEPIKHDLDKVEVFAKKLDEFYRKTIDECTQIDIKLLKQERTRVRKVIKAISDNRKAMVKAYKEPIKDFEETSKRIEKILTGTDDMMKEIVDSEKSLLEDPFAGLTVNEKKYKVVLSASEERFNEFIKIASSLGLNIIEKEEI